MRTLLRELGKRFDSVVVDGPVALGGTADAVVLAGMVGSTVLVAKLGHGTRTALRRAYALLAEHGPVTVLLTGVGERAYERFYGYAPAGAGRAEAYEAV